MCVCICVCVCVCMHTEESYAIHLIAIEAKCNSNFHRYIRVDTRESNRKEYNLNLTSSENLNKIT